MSTSIQDVDAILEQAIEYKHYIRNKYPTVPSHEIEEMLYSKYGKHISRPVMVEYNKANGITA